MENNDSTSEQETIGSLFRRLRLERSLDIADIAEETKIPRHTLRAMEADDYAALPATAFAKGFYSLYAKVFNLSSEEIVQQFLEEQSGNVLGQQVGNVQSPSWQHKNIGTMAERPSMTLGSMIGFGILIIILTSAGISWYAGYNPATQISKWLRGLQEDQAPITMQQPDSPSVSNSKPEGEQDVAELENIPAQPAVLPEAEIYQYLLNAEFSEKTKLTITIDDNAPENIEVQAGMTKSWQAQKSIIMELAPGAEPTLLLNDIAIPIPEASEDKITITIPEYLLDQNVRHSN